MKTDAERLEDMAIAYAQHRKNLRDNKVAIKKVIDDADGFYFDLAKIRDQYYSGECHDLMMGEVIVWRGWLHAVETCKEYNDIDDYDSCGYRATAILLDQRRDIKREGARIRAAFTKIGDKLLKEVTP
ncbi:hypothetical protein HNR03_004040 [Pseudomonas sp. JAI111]|uniref:hypothetical protein n=1 Tax=Pseudomonas sp. JAI111 TaxID=2735913 RepID=UPI0021690DF3|nr:hypothetical protein [Pseudomonas sp. JAI111]MCS3839429.1 hypothetical protein [Pseudomonas sp. JAI111]